ncbi:hypothetical protein D3C76_222090 [compost metagenome]
MKESIKLLNEQADYMSHIFEEGKIGSVIYNSCALVHRIAIDALQELNEKDATIATLRKALEEAKAKLTWNSYESEQIINTALGEGDKE